MVRAEDLPFLGAWSRLWYAWVSSIFLRAYLEVANQTPLIPQQGDDFRVLLDAYLLEKALYELGYELNNRPEWVKIPLHGIREILETSG